jgi:dTDP-4-dehydrorhamnose reductase
MNILLLGADGQLGWQLRRSLCVVGEVTALTRSSDTHCGDITDDAGIARTVRELRPDAIVNAAAYTAVDRAESEPDAAFAVNHRACEVLATEAERIGAWVVHYSTEYVFDGSGTVPWRESDSAAPLNVYGRSKLAGELAIARACPRHLILRTSWLFDTWGDNFLKWVLDAASRRAELDIVDDQWGAPTRAALVADVTAHLLRTATPQLAGTYHVATAGEASRHGYATLALECAEAFGLPLQARAETVRGVSSAAFPTPATRPANSRLDTTRLHGSFGLVLPPWENGVRAVVAEIAAARRAVGRG